MSDIEIHCHLLREATKPSQALQTAINMERGVLNQLKNNSASHLSIKTVFITQVVFSPRIANNKQTQILQGKINQINAVNVDKSGNQVKNNTALH